MVVVGAKARSAFGGTPSPLAGEGWGGGCHLEASFRLDPPPYPSPARGEGTRLCKR